MKFSNLSIEELINPEGFECECGGHHVADIKYIVVSDGAINSVPDILKKMECKYPMVVCGPNGYRAAGEKVISLLKANDIHYKLHVIPCKENTDLEPTEFAVGSVTLNLDHECDMVLAIGSGVINDTCRVVSKTAKIPYIIVGTAPSMDGYASASSSMVVNNVKLSLAEQVPTAIVCDTDIMAKAPMHMLHAGFGDMLAKCTAICMWRIAALVKGETYCPEVAALVRSSLKKVVDEANGLVSRDERAVKSVIEGLLLSGIGMAFIGNSRPASDLDHYFSHCWEMMALAKGEKSDLHGVQVGIGTLLTLKIYEKLKTIKPSIERVESAIENFNKNEWEENIRRVFTDTADEIISMEDRLGKNSPEGRRKRAEKIIDNWDSIVSIINDELHAYSNIEKLMLELGMPTKPEDIGLTNRDAIDAFVCSRDVRDKYLISSLIWDIGEMEDMAKWLEKELENK